MNSQDFYTSIFKNKEKLTKEILKSFLEFSEVNIFEIQNDYYIEVIEKIIFAVEKDLKKEKTNKNQNTSNLIKAFLSVWEDNNNSAYNVNQLIQIIIVCRNILIKNILSLNCDKIEKKNITDSIWNLTDLSILALCKKHDAEISYKSQRDKNIINNLKIVKNDIQKQLNLTYQLIKNSPIGLVGCDSELNIKIWNTIAENLTGYQQSDIIGKSILNIFTIPSQSEIRSQLSHESHRRIRMKLNIQTKEGGIFNADVLINKLTSEMKQKVQYIINIVDLRKEVQLKAQFEKIEQLGAIARLSDAIMHDVRNPINSLALNIDVLTQTLTGRSSLSKEISDIIEKINRQISNLAHSLNRYVGYSRITELKLETIDIGKTLDELLLDTRHRLIGKQISLKYHQPKSQLMIKGDWHQLIRVFINLIDNAIDAIRDKGNIEVIVRKKNRNITISIVDSGSGIKSDDFSNVFKPYYTTKEKGTGLGLFIVREIVRAHRGKVYCTSSDEKGTRFTISIPAIVN